MKAKKFAKIFLPTAELWQPANFARAFGLKKEIPDIEPHKRKYELGGVAYWYDGPSVAIFYRHKRKKRLLQLVKLHPMFPYSGNMAAR